MMTRENAIEAILKYFEENEEQFNETIEELDAWNGYLGDDRMYEMYMLDEFYQGTAPTELLNRTFYGYDADTSDRENGRYGEFNPNREYFYYNGYGNLVSTDYKDYSDRLDEYFVEQVIDNECNLDLPEDVQAIIDEIEE